MKTILELSHIKARQYFLESQNYCNMQFPKYIDFKPVIEYVQNSVGNKELRDILKDPKRMPSFDVSPSIFEIRSNIPWFKQYLSSITVNIYKCYQ